MEEGGHQVEEEGEEHRQRGEEEVEEEVEGHHQQGEEEGEEGEHSLKVEEREE